MDGAPADPAFPSPPSAALPEADGLPEFARRRRSTPELLRAGILRDGCLLVRGLVARDAAQAFADEHRRARSRERERGDGEAAPGCYEEFEPDPRFSPIDDRAVDQGRRRRARHRLAAR